MASLVYVLGFVVCFLCSLLLLRAYARVRNRLLLWSGVCFAGLTASNALLVVDLFAPDVDLYVWRLAVAAVAMLVLLYGLVWESDR
jgi:hypothetical protein